MEKDLQQLGNQIDKYESLSDCKKIKQYYIIKNDMDKIKKNIQDMYHETELSNSDFNTNPDQITEDIFEKNLERASEISELMRQDIPIELSLELLAELQNIEKQCEIYMDNKKMQVDYLD